MSEALYAEHPAVYDALYADKEYDAEVEFVVSKFEERDTNRKRALVVGCGTGEHAKRLTERGFDVTGIDRYEAMVERARTKSNATFSVGALPELPVEGAFDLVFLPFTVINHLSREEFAPSIRALADVLAEGGLLVFDQIFTDSFAGSAPGLQTHSRPDGTYARLIQVHSMGDRRYRWDSLVFTPDGEFFADAHDLTDYAPAFVRGVLDVLGLSVETFDWYGEGESEDSVVFVAY